MTIGGRGLQDWEAIFSAFLEHNASAHADPAHDAAHIHRVVANARTLAEIETADIAVVIPAAWLHDCVVVSKHSPDRSQASRLAAEQATAFLRDQNYPADLIPAVAHAIHAHSFSAGIEPRTLEAEVVQDADRLDALGAIGIARTLLLGGGMGTALYDTADPFARARTPDDKRSVLDHFYTKLLRLSDRMQTAAGREEAERRTAFMREFLAQLELELVGNLSQRRGLSSIGRRAEDRG